MQWCMHLPISQTEKMLQAAEEIVGRYIWGQYDLLVMPPFIPPTVGWRTPASRFVSPTVLVSMQFVLACTFIAITIKYMNMDS